MNPTKTSSKECTYLTLHIMWINTGNAPLKFMLHQDWFFLSSFHPIMLSSASSLAGLVYGYMRKDKVGGTQETAQYFSRRNSLQPGAPTVTSIPSCLLQSFWGMFQVFHGFPWGEITKKTSSHDVDVQKTWLVGLSLFGCGHQSCMGACIGAPFHTKVAKMFLFMLSMHQFWLAVKQTKETLNWWKFKAKHVQLSADVSLIG